MISKRAWTNASPAKEQADRPLQGEPILSPGRSWQATGLSTDVFASSLDWAAARPGLSTAFLGPVSPLWPACRGLGAGRFWGECGDRLLPGPRASRFSNLLREAVRAERRAQAHLHRPSPASPSGAFCGSGAGAEASTTGALNSTLCCGWASRASSKPPLRNWSAAGADSAKAPAFQRSSCDSRAARSDLGLQRREGRAEPARSSSRHPRAGRAPKRRGARRGSSRAPLRRRLRPWPANGSCARSLQRFLPCWSRCADRAPQTRRAGARVRGQLTLRRGNRLRDPLERRFARVDSAQDGGANRPAFLRFVRGRSASRSGLRGCGR